MEKPAALRAAFEAAMPEYAAAGASPDKLRMFVDKGRLVSRLTPALGFEWRYLLRIEFQDFQRSPDLIAVPLLLWLRVNQPERLLDFAREDSALGFAADILDEKTWDLAWAFELTEAVSVAPAADGQYQLTRIPEPPIAGLESFTGAEPPPALAAITLGDRLLLP